MNWKTSIIACISILLALVPKNIFSCADVDDSYDSFAAFFDKYAAETPVYKPFYYSDIQFLRDDEEQPATAAALVKEWVDFTGNKVSRKDAHQFVMQLPRKDLANIYYYLEEHQPLNIPDSVKNNSMTRFFMDTRDLEALGYLMYAKQVEPYVTREYNSWDETPRDSLKMNGLLKNGLQLYRAAKSPLFQLKYAYQVVRLAHYNHQYQDAVQYYDELISPNKTPGILQLLSLGLKAGALYRLGRKPEAAYIFSGLFAASDIKKISNFNSFSWSLPDDSGFRSNYLPLCKNNTERANMLALYSLNDYSIDIATLAEIHQLNPGSAMMPALVVKQINSIESAYLPGFRISKNTGDLYQDIDTISANRKAELKSFVSLLETMNNDKKDQQKGLYAIGAAYISLLLKDYAQANRLLAAAKKMNLSRRLQDQWMLTSLLVTINESPQINAQPEQKILPSLQWLYAKANAAKDATQPGEKDYQWSQFFKNVMTNVIARRYAAQQDLNREVLAYGSTDSISWQYPNGINYVRDSFDLTEAGSLYRFLSKKDFTPYEKFLLKITSVKKSAVADYIGTVHLRNYDYNKAIEWFSKEKQATILKDPFKELLFDREERLEDDRVTTTKLAYAKEMQALLSKPADPEALYKLALGYYNITYYGYAWELATFFRSGSDGYYVPANASPFEKDYYGCYKAEAYFKKALNAASDPEFRAKCLFMIARCSQKQVHKPQYEDFGDNYDYKNYQKTMNAYYAQFKANSYFPQYVKDYSNTRFYKETLTRCSYLKDFLTGR